MPLKVRRKPRKKKIKSEIFDPRLSFRTYTDYINYISQNNIIDIFEMDCVEGKKSDSQVFLTLIHERSGFMIARILPEHTQKEVKRALDKIEKQIGNESFKKIFKVILTDRGHEFQNFEAIESSVATKEKRTQVFYCDPNSAYQKGTIEQSHTLLRRVFPKGRSIDNVTQDELNLAISSINTLTRVKLGGQSPYQVFTRRFGEDTARKLGIEKINLDELTIKNRLFNKK
jgi:IS30 family transposase